MRYIIYDNLGNIRLADAPNDMLVQQCQDGEFLMMGEIDLHTQYIEDHTIKSYTPEEMAARANIPRGHYWDARTRTAVDVRPLEFVRNQTWTRIKDERAKAEAGTFTCDGSTYQTDIQRISGASLLALMALQSGTPYAEEWTLADNTKRVLDATDMIAVGRAQGLHVSKIYETARHLRQKIDAATTVAELDAITWPTL